MKIYKIVALLISMILSPFLKGEEPVTPPVDFYSLSFETAEGKQFKFDQLRGKKVLIVNIASQCGFTPQLKELEELYRREGGKLVILAFPSNDFGAQEPGSNEEILTFCQEEYGVTFPIMAKSAVKGGEKNRVYRWLSEKRRNGWNTIEPSWNFGKYLIDEKGRLIALFPSKVSPNSSEIEKWLR